MKTKNELAKFVYKVNAIPLYITAGLGAYFFAINQTFLNWLLSMALITVMYTGMMAVRFTEGLFNRYRMNLSLIRDPGNDQIYKRIETIGYQMNVLWLMGLALGGSGIILVTRYRQLVVGVIMVCAAIMPAIWYRKLLKDCRTLVRSIVVPVTQPDPIRQATASKRRFYRYFVSLISASFLSTFLFGACAYLISTGVRTEAVFILLFIGCVGLAAIPFLSGVVVKKLGLPEEVEV